MSCPGCGKRVPILFNALEERRCLKCLGKARIRTVKEQQKARALNSANEEEEMSSFTPQELKDLSQALNVLIDEYVGLDAPNKTDRLYRLQDKIGNMIKEGNE